MTSELVTRARALPLVVVLAAAVGAGCLTPYEKGTKLYGAGEYESAQRALEKGLERRPEDPKLNLAMARTLVAREEYREAQAYAKKAFDADETRGRGGRILGKIHWELGRALEAVEAWRESREVDGELVPDEDFRRALVAAIGTADSSHKYRRALELRDELAEIAPDHPEVQPDVLEETRKKRAEDLVQRGEYRKAAEVYATLLEKSEGKPQYAYERGRLLLRLKKPDQAREAFDQYVSGAGDADRLERTLDVARRARELDAPGTALVYYRRAVEALGGEPTFRRAKLRLTLAKLLFQTDNSAEAREHIRGYLSDMRSLRGVPLAAEVYRTAANTASEAGRTSLAIELLEDGLENAPPNWSVASKLAEKYAVQARQRRASEVLDTYIERAENKGEALLNAAKWAKERRNYDLAKKFYERLVERDPERAEGWLALGKLYAKLGQIENMKDAFETFVDEHGSDRHDLLSVASAYEEQQLYRDAERVLEEVRRRNPESLIVVDRLAQLYREWGKPVRIQKAYEKWIEARGGSASDYQVVGERLLRRQKYRQALPFFEKAAEEGLTEAWLHVADIYKQQRRELDMKEALQKYVDQASNRTRALRAALERYRGTSLTRETTRVLEELVDREPGVRAHYERLGQAYLTQGRREDAFALWQRYVDRAADEIEALSRVAQWFEQAGDSELTLEFYRRWMRGKDPDPRLYKLMADAYMDLAPARWRRRTVSASAAEDAQENARRLYRRYLREADPSPTELTSFASSMRRSNMWKTAARAYRQVVGTVSNGSKIRLHFGESMLHLGRVRRAEKAFETYYEARGKGPKQARQIADKFIEFQYLERAEPYLERMFESDDSDVVQKAFVELAKVYQHTGRSGRISELVETFLNRAPNPAKARQTAVSVLEGRGLYAEAADQIEQIREFQGNVLGFRHGVNLFRAGRIEEAHQAFRRHASQSPYSASVWLKIANFYERHARPERARGAYDEAVEAAPDDSKPREERGRFHLLRGNDKRANDNFENALERAKSKRRDAIRKTWVETLRNVGRYGRAAKLAGKALKSATKNRDFFLQVLAIHQLQTGDESRVNRMVQRVSSSSLPLERRVRLLVEHGHRPQAAELIEQQLATGNFASAGRAMVNHPGVFTRLGGLDALQRAARPLLKQHNSQAAMRARLGEYFIRQGRYEEGIAYLQSALEDGRALFQPMLAHAYLLQGRRDRAFEIFRRQLANYDGARRSRALRHVGTRFELAGEFDWFEAFLENLATDPNFGAAALELLVELRVESGAVADALGRVRERIDLLSTGGPERVEFALDRPDAAERTLKALRGIAAAGLREEAAALLGELPERVRKNPDFRNFGVHLAAARDAEGLGKRVERSLKAGRVKGGGSRADRRLSYARVLAINGHYGLAGRTARPLLDGADHNAIQRSTRFLIRNAYLRGRRGTIGELTRGLFDSVSDELASHKRVGHTLRKLGLDDRAFARFDEVAKRAPTNDNVRQALGAATAAGRIEESKRLLKRYVRIVDDPLRGLRSRWQSAVDRQSKELTKAYLQPYRKTYPARLDARIARARLAFRVGNVATGRRLLTEYLERVDYGARAVNRVLRFLDDLGLHYEIADVFEPKLDETPLTNQSRRYLGYAAVEMGREKAGEKKLRAALRGASDPIQAATEIADVLADRDHMDLAGRFADRAIQRAPSRQAPYFYRGLAAAARGDAKAAESDLDRGMDATSERIEALHRAGRAALEGGNTDLAAKYLEKLARIPNSEQTGMLLPFRKAMEAYVRSDHGKTGVDFLESRFSRIATYGGLGGTAVSLKLSALYQAADLPERAFDVYREGIARERIQDPLGAGLPIRLNNLAYVYSTTNRNVSEGLDLVRRAIAGARRRTPNYLDTLGWLQYRRGNYARAEETIRRALRTTLGSTRGLVELYRHLAILREAQGDTESAFWLRRFYESLEH